MAARNTLTSAVEDVESPPIPLSGRKKILVVSDSLGRPVHRRGIFYYTSNLVRALRTCGHDVYLMVERTGTHIKLDRRLDAAFSAAAPKARLLDIYNYLWVDSHIWDSHQSRAKNRLRRFVANDLLRQPEKAPLISTEGLRLSLGLPALLTTEIVSNDVSQIDFVPEGLDHLLSISAFVLCPSVYSLSEACAAAGLQAPTVDATGFDTILVDTPTNLRFKTSSNVQILSVIHDLLPLSDPTISKYWRKVFSHKLAQTIKNANAYIFVSAFSHQRFKDFFPEALEDRRVSILPPSVDESIAREGDRSSRRSEKTNMPTYFVAIVSDEVRKNIATLVAAFSLLPHDLGLKVIGNVNSGRYGHGPDQVIHLPGGLRAARASQIEWLGHVSEMAKRKILAEATGVVVPSFAEGFGIPVIEGCFFGKPVFCSDIPVFREVIGDNGFYFDPASPRSIADAIESYLDNRQACAQRVEQASADARRRFSLSVVTQETERYFSFTGQKV
jgi:glycosyltransferase involved in cell wall biosynthesis